MSEKLEKEIKNLKGAIEGLSKPRTALVKYLGPFITIIVLSGGIVGTWYTQKANMQQMQKDLSKLELVVENQNITIQDIKIKAVRDSSDVAHIKEKVDNMDKKLDRLLENNR